VSQDSAELFLLLVFSMVLLSAFAAIALGLSEAIGAFMLGLLVAETLQKDRVQLSFPNRHCDFN